MILTSWARVGDSLGLLQWIVRCVLSLLWQLEHCSTSKTDSATQSYILERLIESSGLLSSIRTCNNLEAWIISNKVFRTISRLTFNSFFPVDPADICIQPPPWKPGTGFISRLCHRVEELNCGFGSCQVLRVETVAVNGVNELVGGMAGPGFGVIDLYRMSPEAAESNHTV